MNENTLLENQFKKGLTNKKQRVKFKTNSDAKRLEIRNKRKAKHHNKFDHIVL